MGSKFGIPTLLIFLLLGMGFRTIGITYMNEDVVQMIGLMAMSVIIFTGGMETKFNDIKPVLLPGILLSTFGVLITAILTGVFIWWISGFKFTNIEFPLIIALLLAATMSSTDSASVFSILKSNNIKLKHNLRPMLELESGSNDPVAYMLTITLTSVAVNQGVVADSGIAVRFIIQFVLGGVIGFLIGLIVIQILRSRFVVKTALKSLYPMLVLAAVFLTYSLTNMFHGNGYLAVYVAGMVFGNEKECIRFLKKFTINRIFLKIERVDSDKEINKKDITRFLDSMTLMFQMALFLSLGLLVDVRNVWYMVPISLLISIFMMAVARPAVVFVLLGIPFKSLKEYKWRDKAFISWVGLRGAAPILFATYPFVNHVPGSEQIFSIVFIVTLISLLIQGSTIAKSAKMLKLDEVADDDVRQIKIDMLDDKFDNEFSELILTKDMLANGDTLKDIKVPDNKQVILVKRKDDCFAVNGKIKLYENDILLTAPIYDDLLTDESNMSNS